jgi:hypothetical protein
VKSASIPLGDAGAFRGQRNRARLMRIGLALAMLAAAVAALIFAGAPAATVVPLLPPRSSGVVVVDLSASTDNGEFALMYAGLMHLAASKGRYGLVVFSDRAYEVLPPDAPAADLKQLAYFFHPVTHASLTANVPSVTPSGGVNFNTGATQYPANPWASGFTLGTTISAGLELAASIIEANPTERRSVWLLSDLGDNPPDLPLVSSAGREFAQDGIRLNVVALDPAEADAKFFASIIHLTKGTLTLAKPLPRQRKSDGTGFPLGLGIAIGALVLLLAANELTSTPLRFGLAAETPKVASS